MKLIQEDFELAIQNLVPSVSEIELARYDNIRQEFAKEKQTNNTVNQGNTVEQGELELDGAIAR